MFRKIISTVIFFLLTVPPVFDQNGTAPRVASKPASAPFILEAELYEESPRITKVVFKNGLTALVYESHAQPLVSVQAYVGAGFLDDTDENVGLAELTARARANIGEGSTLGTVRVRARALGGVFNIRVGPRYSRFEITVPAARWRQALNIKAEALLTPFENNEALRFDAVRLAENMRDEFAPPDVLARKELLALAFGERRFSPADHLSKIDSGEIIEFHKSRYIPSAITLVIAGDVRASDALNEVVRVFSSKNESETAVSSAGTGLKPAGEFRYRALSGDTAFPKVFFGFTGPSENSADYRALEVVAAILGTGETSVLNTRLRDGKNLILMARVEVESFDGTGFFTVELETELKNIDRTEIAFWAELEILRRNGPSETELARAVAQLERLWWEQRQTVDEQAHKLAGFEFQGGWKRMDNYFIEIRNITADDVKRVITKYLTFSNCVLLEYLPRSLAERNLTAATALGTLESLLRPAVEEELLARIGELEPNFKIPSAAASLRLNEVRHPFQLASILRGPEIYIREDRASPLLEMGFYFTGGKTQENEANAGITSLMLELMLRNERENRQLEIYGGRLTPVVTDDYFGFFLSIPARNISGGLERIKQAIKSPVFAAAETERLKRIAGVRASAEPGKGLSCLKESLFRTHPYATESLPTAVSLKNISVETVMNWYEENVLNVNPFVAIVGNTEGTSLAAWFVNEFSGSRMRERKNIVSSPKPVEKAESFNYVGAARHSVVLQGFQAPSAGDTNVYNTHVLKKYLENYFWETGLTPEKNQESVTLTRSVSCEYRPLLAGGSFIISATVREGAMRSLEILRENIARFVLQPLRYADFSAARTLAAGSYMAENQTRKAQIENLTKNLLAGRSLAEYQEFSQKIEKVEEEDFREMVRGVLDMNKAVTVIIPGGDR